MLRVVHYINESMYPEGDSTRKDSDVKQKHSTGSHTGRAAPRGPRPLRHR